MKQQNSSSSNIRTRKSRNRAEVSLPPQHAVSRSASNRSLVSIDPMHLLVTPDLPQFLQSSCSTTATRSDDGDDGQSFTRGMLAFSSSSYYIPGITEKSRLLLNDSNDQTSRRRPVSTRKGSARNLYTPTSTSSSRSLDNDSFSSSLPSQEWHSSLPLVLEFSPEELLDKDDSNDDSLRRGRDYCRNNRQNVEANVSISPKGMNGEGKIQSEQFSSNPHQEHQRTITTIAAKALLRSQLGSIQDVWEEHDSRKGVQSFRMYQILKQEKKQQRLQKKQEARSIPEPPHQRASYRSHQSC